MFTRKTGTDGCCTSSMRRENPKFFLHSGQGQMSRQMYALGCPSGRHIADKAGVIVANLQGLAREEDKCLSAEARRDADKVEPALNAPFAA